MPIPLKGFLDLIVKEEEDFIIEDHKLVGKITPQEKPCPAYEIQACEYWFLTRKVLGINPKRMVFRQTKKSKNACELNIEEIEALFEKNGLEFEEVSEKTQLIEIFKFNNISEVTIPEHVKLIADLAVADIKKVLEEKGIEFAKGAKKDELIKACAEN